MACGAERVAVAALLRRRDPAPRGRGRAGMADAPGCGGRAKADAASLAALERAADTPPRALGLGFDVWTAARLSAYLAEATGVAVAPGWPRTLLGRRGFACGRPKHTLGHLRD